MSQDQHENHEQHGQDDQPAGALSRRSALKRAGAVAALGVWTVPVTQTLARPAFAAGSMPSFGNGAAERRNVDTFADFVVYDTNTASAVDGTVTSIDYYAGSPTTDVSGRSFTFLLVDPSGVVRWKSDAVLVPANGSYTFTPVTPPAVQTGWFVGFYSVGQGVISYDDGGSGAPFTDDSSGEPAVGETLPIVDSRSREYSFLARTAS